MYYSGHIASADTWLTAAEMGIRDALQAQLSFAYVVHTRLLTARYVALTCSPSLALLRLFRLDTYPGPALANCAVTDAFYTNSHRLLLLLYSLPPTATNHVTLLTYWRNCFRRKRYAQHYSA